MSIIHLRQREVSNVGYILLFFGGTFPFVKVSHRFPFIFFQYVNPLSWNLLKLTHSSQWMWSLQCSFSHDRCMMMQSFWTICVSWYMARTKTIAECIYCDGLHRWCNFQEYGNILLYHQSTALIVIQLQNSFFFFCLWIHELHNFFLKQKCCRYFNSRICFEINQ